MKSILLALSTCYIIIHWHNELQLMNIIIYWYNEYFYNF